VAELFAIAVTGAVDRVGRVALVEKVISSLYEVPIAFVA
jgi:hypothetical protein